MTKLASGPEQQAKQAELDASLAALEQQVQQEQQQRASLQTSLQAAVESNSSLSGKLDSERQQQEQQARELQAQLVVLKAQGLALRRQQGSKESRWGCSMKPLLLRDRFASSDDCIPPAVMNTARYMSSAAVHPGAAVLGAFNVRHRQQCKLEHDTASPYLMLRTSTYSTA